MHLDCLVCLGGGGTQKNALHLMRAGQIPVLTLPKTIDNDVAETDVSFGYDTAMTIAAEAIDRLHTTAESHHRLMVVEIMGHRTGWLALGAGVAGGADVILIPEIPYDLEAVAASVVSRNRKGKRFSIVALAEGALSKEDAAAMERARAAAAADKAPKDKAKAGAAKRRTPSRHAAIDVKPAEDALPGTVGARIAARLQEMTGLESRVTVLGHLQRGGTPSPFDRLLATRLGVAAAKLLDAGQFGVMVAARGDQCVPVPLEDVAGKRKLVPLDHPLLETARLVGTCLGDS
ncbi:MAG TPA: ATP-dependent 6-phosphofructokinase, partial [Armatimonadota bacterium]|nr:ATP-dependent 6-phosphofructokinase [Armatimonadota bacterium]